MAPPRSADSHRLIVGIYTLTIFVSAALLFVLQPMFARMALPLLGGSPAVWNTAVVFYQCVLLAGYAYAYALTRWISLRRQLVLHLAVLPLPLLVLPIDVPANWLPAVTAAPVLSLLALLSIAVGLPFFIVSTTSPLLQRWFVESGHARAADPYFLYGASNLGSLLSLLGYPLVVERWLRLSDQGRWWAGGYLLLVALVGACVAIIWRRAARSTTAAPSHEELAPAPTLHERLMWLGLAAAPVSLMLSVTTYLSTDISAIPLLWVIPLALYLLTFVLTFASRPLVPHSASLVLTPLGLAGLIFLIAAKQESTERWFISGHLLTFFVVAMACHGELARRRPPPVFVAEFYLWVSLGGALGGLFNSLVAPVLFDQVVEYPLTLVITALLIAPRTAPSVGSAQRKIANRRRARRLSREAELQRRSRLIPLVLDLTLPLTVFALTTALVWTLQDAAKEADWSIRAVMFGLPVLICLTFVRRPIRFGLSLGAIVVASAFYTAGKGTLIYADRTFFGLNRVMLVPSGRYHVLGHGNTMHGAQSLDPARRREPLTYFDTNGPLGEILAPFNREHPDGRVAVVGLGAGSTACYRQPGQAWTFYEIDPAVVEIARDPGLFTFLRDCAPDARIVVGDARLSLKSAAPGEYDLIVLDAYSSDAIPIHLITREAIRLYLDKLSPNGLLVFNISNRHLDLGTVLANLALDAGLAYRARNDLQIDPGLAGRGMMPSQWAVLARSSGALGGLADNPTWVQPAPRPDTTVWTDDFNNLLSVFVWQ